MDLTGLPPVRRRISGVLSIDAKCLRSRFRKEGVGAADARDPNYPVGPGDHGPARAAAARDACILKASDQEAAAGAAEGTEALAGGPHPDDQRSGRKPGGQAGALLAFRRDFAEPPKPPPTPGPLTLCSLDRPSRRDGIRLGSAEHQAIERHFSQPPLAERQAGTVAPSRASCNTRPARVGPNASDAAGRAHQQHLPGLNHTR
jgi:hypothetical protein